MGKILGLLKNLFPSSNIVVILVALAGLYLVYRWGHSDGEQEVNLNWEIEKRMTREASDKIKAEYDRLAVLNHAENLRISHELAEAKTSYEVSISRQSSDYEQRLSLSETRAEAYKRKAKAGSVECGNLASHAAKLDRSLEQGRSLVREFGTTLRFRDRQLIELGKQIINDRKLMIGDN